MKIKVIGEDKYKVLLSTYFAKESKEKLLLVDSIIGKRLIPIEFSLEDEIVFDLYDYLNTTIDLETATVEASDEIFIIASSYLKDKIEFDEEEFQTKLDEISNSYDNIIFISNDKFDSMTFNSDFETISIAKEEQLIVTRQKNDKKVIIFKGKENDFENELEKIYTNYIENKEYANKSIMNKLAEFFGKNNER